MGRPRKSLSERFWNSVPKEPSGSGCLEWMGTIAADGYGVISEGGGNGRYGGRQLKAHRVAWELVRGPIPSGLLVCHRCDNPPCVADAHLFLGTHADNNADRSRKGRTTRQSHPKPKGELSPTSKLSNVERDTIQIVGRLEIFTKKQLAHWFSITPQRVGQITKGAP